MMNRKNMLAAMVVGVAAISAPLLAQAEETTSTVTTPSDRYNTVQQTAPTQRKTQAGETAQQAQQRGETWRGMSNEERQEAYQNSAQTVQQQGQEKYNAAQQRNQQRSNYGNRGR